MSNERPNVPRRAPALTGVLPVLCLALCAGPALLRGADQAPTAEILLRFRDGERIRGRITGREPGILIVETARFGTQRVRLADLEDPPQDATPAAAPAVPPAASPLPGDSDVPNNALALLERLRRPLRFWHAGINLALEAKQEDIQRSSLLVELRASHEFSRDEVRGNGSYERVHENSKLTTDIAKGEAYWRHDLSPAWFTLYTHYLEWNRNYSLNDIRYHYLLAQQQFGFGRTLFNSAKLRLRAGVAENFLNLWVLDHNLQAATSIESVFGEADLQFARGVHVTNRVSYYYAVRNGDQGQKNEFEISKDLTAFFKIRLRHEYRRNLPLSNVGDINLWRLVFGLEY